MSLYFWGQAAMGMTNIERAALKGNTALSGRGDAGPSIGPPPDPLAVRLAEAQRISGFSRSDLYRRAARGEIVFLKCGNRVLVDFASLRAALASLPPDGCQLTSTGVMLQPWLSEPMTSTDSTPTSTTVSYITPSSGSAFDDNLQFIYSTSAGETLAAAAPTPDEFVFTSFAAGPHTITGFNPTQDVIEFSKAQFAAIANVEAATTAMAGGAMINLGNGSELLLPGVDPTSLQASNFALA